MDNIRDWCISRQIWWGHRIPAWHCDRCGQVTVAVTDPSSCSHCSGTSIHQDPDVLDTWFSSALWPFSTLGWPEDTQEYRTFYPTSVLVTSFDIIFFWVARMMMMGIKFTGRVPFSNVYIHALIRDIHGKKMSKSRGNVIDPLFLMSKYGTDALRFTLTVLAAQGRDIKISEDRVAGYRNFANKIWNSARFVFMNLDGQPAPDIHTPPSGLSLADKWIITRFSRLSAHVREALDTYSFDEAGRSLYQFFWHEFCDWYLEMAKPALKEGDEVKSACRWTLLHVLEGSLRLLHPFMPFITEEIWQKLPLSRHPGASIMTAPFSSPRPDLIYPEAAEMDRIIPAIESIRTIRGEINIPPSTRLNIILRVPDAPTRDAFASNLPYILTLSRGQTVDITLAPPRLTGVTASAMAGDTEVFVKLDDVVDIRAEIARVEKNLKKFDEDLLALRKKLSNQDFLAKAPQEVTDDLKDRAEDTEGKRQAAQAALHRLHSLKKD